MLHRSQIGYTHRTLVNKFAGHTAFACANDCAQHVCKGVSVASELHKGHGVVYAKPNVAI